MSEYKSNINWFPGHMAKARRQMEESLKQVDLVIELRDARIPKASANPLLAQLAQNKPVLIILNKADLADDQVSARWKEALGNCLLIDSVSQNITRKVTDAVKTMMADKLERAKARGIRKNVLRAMVVGWPRIDDHDDALLLALLGSIRDDILDREELALFGLESLRRNYPGTLEKRYGIDEGESDLIEQIGRQKLWLDTDGQINREKTIEQILKDIRSNRIGKISYQDAGEQIRE